MISGLAYYGRYKWPKKALNSDMSASIENLSALNPHMEEEEEKKKIQESMKLADEKVTKAHRLSVSQMIPKKQLEMKTDELGRVTMISGTLTQLVRCSSRKVMLERKKTAISSFLSFLHDLS